MFEHRSSSSIFEDRSSSSGVGDRSGEILEESEDVYAFEDDKEIRSGCVNLGGNRRKTDQTGNLVNKLWLL